MSGFVPEDKFVPDAPGPQIASGPAPGFIPDSQFVSDEEKFGGTSGELKAGALGAARSMTLGLSDVGLSKSGLVNPETIKGLEQTNPIASGVGEGAGLVAAHFYGVGEAEDAINAAKLAVKVAAKTGNAAEIAKATEAFSAIKNTMGAGDVLNPIKAISKLGGKVSESVGPGVLGTTAGLATEGGLFGVGNTVSDIGKNELSLGDPDEIAESLMHNVGYSSLIGGGLGAALGVGAKAVSKIPETVGAASKTLKKATSAVDQILSDVPRAEAPIVDPAPFTGVKPTSVEELQKRAAKSLADGTDISLPQQAALADAASRLEMENPLTPMQVDSLSSQGKRDEYRIMKEMPGEYRDLLQTNEALQKQELVAKTDEAIRAISPNVEPTFDAVEAGHRAAKAFTDVIEGNRNELGQKIQELKESSGDWTKLYHVPGVIDAMVEGNPKLANIFDTSGKEVALKPWDGGMGITKKAYNNISTAVDALKKYPSDFEKLFDIRKGLMDGVNPLIADDTSPVLTKAKKSMMDYIQQIIQKESPNENVREWFKKYAINEENAKIIEKKFGAEIGSDNFRSVAKNKPSEKILDNIFRDTESVKAARSMLSPDQFNEMLANHMAEQKALATIDGAFSSNKFFSRSLRGNQDALNEAFAYRPEIHQKIKDLNTVMRILPDSVSINPSGTAKTLLGSLRGTSALDVLNNVKEFGLEKWNRQQTIDELNKRLAGNAETVEKLSILEKAKERLWNQISSSVKSIFNAGEASAGFFASKMAPEERAQKHSKFAQDLNSLNNNPQEMLGRLTKATQDLYPAAPNTTSSVQSLAVRTTQFLASKVPHDPISSPLMKPSQPSKTELAKFERYQNAVEDPVSVLNQIKSGTLTNEAIETLQVVYPKMYNRMKQKIFDQITSLKDPSKIPYQIKLSLSRFMGEPLTNSLLPQSIVASQMVYAQPSSQQVADQKMMKPNSKGMSKMTLADRTNLRPGDEV